MLHTFMCFFIERSYILIHGCCSKKKIKLQFIAILKSIKFIIRHNSIVHHTICVEYSYEPVLFPGLGLRTCMESTEEKQTKKQFKEKKLSLSALSLCFHVMLISNLSLLTRILLWNNFIVIHCKNILFMYVFKDVYGRVYSQVWIRNNLSASSCRQLTNNTWISKK